jgi:hypothetical protein
MKQQEVIAPQFGYAATRVADDIQELSVRLAAAPSGIAYSGASSFRPSTAPTVVVKTVKRRQWSVDADIAGGPSSRNAAVVLTLTGTKQTLRPAIGAGLNDGSTRYSSHSASACVLLPVSDHF